MKKPKDGYTWIRQGKIRKLAVSLDGHGVSEEDRDYILQGAKDVPSGDKDALTAWEREGMRRLDERLPPETVRAVREGCACCTGGKRHELAKQIFRENPDLPSRAAALSKAWLIVGHSAELRPDGRVIVRFSEKAESMTCPCLRVSDVPMPMSHCRCCAGHIRGHVETALGGKYRVEPLSTLLSSCGKEPCLFELTPAGDA